MNHLALIKDNIQKRERLSEAQRLMAKAYRGVEYADARQGQKSKSGPTDLIYRGITYQV